MNDRDFSDSIKLSIITDNMKRNNKPHIPDEEVQECINAWNNRPLRKE